MRTSYIYGWIGGRYKVLLYRPYNNDIPTHRHQANELGIYYPWWCIKGLHCIWMSIHGIDTGNVYSWWYYRNSLR